MGDLWWVLVVDFISLQPCPCTFTPRTLSEPTLCLLSSPPLVDDAGGVTCLAESDDPGSVRSFVFLLLPPPPPEARSEATSGRLLVIILR